MPYIGKSPSFGVRNKFVYLASASDTSVSGADANGATLTFTDGAYVDVYLNGVLLKPTTDYNTTTANTIAGISSMAANDEVTVVVYDVFAVSDTVSATSGGGFSGAVTVTITDNTDNLTLTSTDADANGGPNLRLYRNSGSPADGDMIGQIDFEGRNDNSQDIVAASIRSVIDDVSDGTEDSRLIFETITAGSAIEPLRFIPGETVFNEGSADVDFRVEGNSFANLLKLDASSDTIGIGIATPTFATGRGMHFTDDFHIGFGTGNGTRPDFQLGYDSTNTRLALKCGTGSDDTDFFFTTGGNIQQNGNNAGLIQEINNAHGSGPYGIRINFTAADPDNNDNYFLLCEANGANKLKIFSDGDIDNHDNSYSGFSDERIKQDIVDSTSQWDDIKAIKVRNFKFKSDVTKYGDKAWSRIGVIAQELETVSPKLIKESTPDPSEIKINSEFGTLYEDGDTIPDGKKVGDVKEVKSKLKSVTYSILYMKAVKALQEAMARIETLEAKVKTLEEA
jgi:hypothetical protein